MAPCAMRSNLHREVLLTKCSRLQCNTYWPIGGHQVDRRQHGLEKLWKGRPGRGRPFPDPFAATFSRRGAVRPRHCFRALITLTVSHVVLEISEAYDEGDDVFLPLITAQSDSPLPCRHDRSPHDRPRKHAMNICETRAMAYPKEVERLCLVVQSLSRSRV